MKNMNNQILNEKLSIIKSFQDKYPDSHVGGSIGLYLHGIDLKRDISKSDIDMTKKYKLPETEKIPFDNYQESSSPSDFDYSFRAFESDNAHYAKMEIRVTTEPSFVVINHDGINYNVSKLEDIIFWKQKYADKEIQKHIDDLIVINGGERPKQKQQAYNEDDLPF